VKNNALQTATSVPVARIVRLVAKAIRLGRGGYTREELRELAADLLDLGATVLAIAETQRAA
jgi:hypothetical protein